ncbi:hypothetical protein NLJ89_g5148 [Agrocybe chaxingu]|uniref:Phytanoyl-CoA dioxygenase n=1 Tax=Agrocybe chaxingu TaxID=84603 RepID=A0A9W8K7R8_9AGAR|nr:hypothetical protein NLJ89_g5148 [Agrocybe chaxingu]
MISDLKTHYDEQGYVIVPGLIETKDFDELEKACNRIIARTREGLWPHRRTVGKQFPPYGDNDPDSWGVQHVMHPQLGESIFAKWYTSPKLLAAATSLLGCGVEDLQMELFNLLINPVSHDFALRWHRDDIPESATEKEEQEALNIWHYGIQWNTALYPDSCLYVVPGSHKIPRTPEQRRLSSGQIPEQPLDMPGAIQVSLKPGETVFYNSNILHCAAYSSKERRATLHACIGDANGGSTRARNVLQHGLDWMKGPEFRDSLPTEDAKVMFEKLLAMYNTTDRDRIGFSLQN